MLESDPSFIMFHMQTLTHFGPNSELTFTHRRESRGENPTIFEVDSLLGLGALMTNIILSKHEKQNIMLLKIAD